MRRFILITALLPLLAGCSKPETLKEAMATLDQAVIERDADTIARYLGDKEARFTSAQQVRDFVNGPLAERSKGFEPLGDRKVMIDEPGHVAWERYFRAQDGRQIGFTMQIYATEEGPRAMPLLAPLVMMYESTWRPADAGLSLKALSNAWAEATEETREDLERMGLKGMLVNRPGRDEFMTWDEWKQLALRMAKSQK